MLQQQPQQFLRVRQCRLCGGVILGEEWLVCHDRDKGLAEGCIDSVVLDEGDEEVIGGETAGFGIE